eukprot:3053056-Alexandrium_andersonii.AAC.1
MTPSLPQARARQNPEILRGQNIVSRGHVSLSSCARFAKRPTFRLSIASSARTCLRMPRGAHTATHAPPTQTQDTSETHTLPLELRHVRAPYDTQRRRQRLAK